MKMKKLKVEVPEFSPEIIADILTRLPVDLIVACKRVCKIWRTLIDDPSFLYTWYINNNNNIQSSVVSTNSSSLDVDENSISFGFFIMGTYMDQTLRYGEYTQTKRTKNTSTMNDDDQVRFELTKPIKYPSSCYKYSKQHCWELNGSSNGLICLSTCHLRVTNYQSWPWLFDITIYVYNPMTREYVDLGTETSHSYVFSCMGTFLGYHPSTKEYKVVRIDYKEVPNKYHVQVYTLGTGTSPSPGGSSSRWRDKGEISYLFNDLKKPKSVLFNGALHWTTKDRKIVSFDLEDEEFRIAIPSPPLPPQPILAGSALKLAVLGGCLCAYDFNRVYEKYKVPMHIWILRGSSNNYNYNYSWNNILSLWRFCTPVLALSRTGMLVYNGNKIASYNSEYQNFRSVSKESFDRLPVIISYTKSFLSLKALGEENVKMISHDDDDDDEDRSNIWFEL